MPNTDWTLIPKRLLAFSIDWFVIACWGGLLFAAVTLLFAGNPPSLGGPFYSQSIGFVFMTLPVILYFSLCESSNLQATIGKRVLGLYVAGINNARPDLNHSIRRNLIKFAPWELGHTVANQAVFADSVLPDWVYVPMALSMLLPLWFVLYMVLNGHTPYDKLSSTWVHSRLK